ncbi:hypothetical protein Lsai_3005 [Legionella sainthelensi]|uniref:Uncharacterized protein n=1 Tax=Legionella sainthelensi TaxID=28087 RepID=A0A0W0YBF5_9GAMM|nr:hypothetical protein [Legionella sainthelensi]KTD54183.1 hypothetical protein Lsai_3005 [Legionella sainthelensi]VEH29682.1 Uncharacterised protein [Legionella sainthelensi]
MKFGTRHIISAKQICNSITNEIPITLTNMPMYKAAIQNAEYILKNLKQNVNKGEIYELKNAVRQLKADLELYFTNEAQSYLKEYVQSHEEEIVHTDRAIQKKSILTTLGLFKEINTKQMLVPRPIQKEIVKHAFDDVPSLFR